MKKITLVLVIALLILFSFSAHAADFILGQSTSTASSATTAGPVFTRSLSIGMSGQDVQALNAILDLEFNTTIANPSTFSASTQSYVTELQERYASAILTPIGLTAGTGFVGSATIPELNTLAQQYNITLTQFPAPVVAAVTPVKQVFTQNLSLGTVSSDVILLKTVLNSDPATALVYTSQTTTPADVFDAATEAAVIKFQDKYASTILTPLGLTAGTGFVGPSTRNKLNQILAGFSSTTVSQNNLANSNTVKTTISTAANLSGNTPTTGGTSPGVTGTPCTQNQWSCDPTWGQCSADPANPQSGIQTRSCTEIFFCGDQTNVVAPTTQSCALPASASANAVAEGQLPTCPDTSTQTKTFTQDLNIYKTGNNGPVASRQGGFSFTLQYQSAYPLGTEAATLSGNVGITDGGPFSADQINMNIDNTPTNLVQASVVGLYHNSEQWANQTGAQTFALPTTPGSYSFHVSDYLADVYDSGLIDQGYSIGTGASINGVTTAPIGPKGPKIFSSGVVDSEDIPFTIYDPSTCVPAPVNVNTCGGALEIDGSCYPTL